MEENDIKKAAFNEYRRWFERTKGDQYHEKLNEISSNEDEITDAFMREIPFRAEGLTGLIGPGTNRINKYVIRRVTQGISDYIKKEHKPISVVIGYDNRRGSKYFAFEAASVFRGNLIKPFLFGDVTPAPLLSYAVRSLGCDLGVMITAGHEPKIYNGYRLYNKDGYLISEEDAEGIRQAIDKIDYFAPDIFMDSNSGIFQADPGLNNDYVEEAVSYTTIEDKSTFDDFKVIYTPLHGTGGKCFADIMKKSGIKYETVSCQAEPDKEFPTCPVPNPEKIMAYNESFKWLDEHDGDIIIANDPACMRVGCAIKHDGMRTVLTGNQTGILLLDYLCHIKPPKQGQIMINGIASSPLARKIAEKNGLTVKTTMAGLEFAGEEITELEKDDKADELYFAFEECDEYITCPFVRERDGLSTALLIAEMAAFHKAHGKNLIDRLYELYNEYGICVDKTRNYFFSGIAGIQTIDSIMDHFRSGVNQTIGGRSILSKKDHLETEGAAANCIEFDLDDGSKLIIRPSDTDSIIKIYSFETCDFSDVEKEIADIVDQFKSAAADN